MNRHTIITMMSLAVIVGSLAYSTAGMLAAEDLQIRWNQKSGFDFLTMLNGGIVHMCNPSFMQVGFNGINIIVSHQDEEMGRFIIDGYLIKPNTSTEIAGVGKMDRVAGRIFFGYIDTEISGKDIARFNDENISIRVETETTVLGFIPVMVEKVYPAQEFQDMMNDKSNSYRC